MLNAIQDILIKESIPYEVDEFWTSKQRQGNRIHEISYRACFKSELPTYFIERFSRPGDIVYDPFMGRGTTPIEANILNRIPYGNDLSPLSKIFTEPRIKPPLLSEIDDRLNKIELKNSKNLENQWLLPFYHQDTLLQIESLRRYFKQKKQENALDDSDQWIQMTAINRLSGHSSGFFSVRSMPPNQAVTVERQKIINQRNNTIPIPKDIKSIIYKKSKILLKDAPSKAKNYLLLSNKSHLTHQIPNEVVSLTVTSPPFLDLVDYNKDNWLRNWFIDTQEPDVTILKNLKDWIDFTYLTLKELCRITKNDGYIAYEVGEVRNGHYY